MIFINLDGFKVINDNFGYEQGNQLLKLVATSVQGIGISEEDEGIIKSVLSLAENLGLKTIAEGVETEKQVDFLNKTSCDHLQGYHFHKPMPPAEMEQFLTNHS